MAPRSFLIRVVAVLLLLIAGADAYACDFRDTCAVTASDGDDTCDSPAGDSCICCCHHVVPMAEFALQPAEAVESAPPAEPVLQPHSIALPIDHPPQL